MYYLLAKCAGTYKIFSIKVKKTLDDLTIKMFYSKCDEQWALNFKGKLAGKLVDTGNGYVIKVEDKVIEVDYSQAEILFVLLNQANKNSTFPSEYTKLKKV